MAQRVVTILALIGAVGLAACSDNARFGGAGGSGASAGSGVAQNPNSPAYFETAIGDRVLFEVDQSTLTSQAQATLDGQANWLNTNTSYAALIEGHADEQGTREYNIALGERRANAVQEYLISRGVAGTRLDTVSWGKERPLEICSEEACYAKNRRAVTVLRAAAGS